MIPITWPFATWGLDMVGPFKRSKDKKTHLLVAVDKFTKWVRHDDHNLPRGSHAESHILLQEKHNAETPL